MRISHALAAVAAAAIAGAFALPASSQPKTAPLKLSAAERQVVWENIWQGQLSAIPIGFEASLGTDAGQSDATASVGWRGQ